MIRLSSLLLLPLAACAAGDRADFPSLAERPVERRSDEIETPPPAPPAPADAALAAELARLLADARRGEADFASALPAVERAVSAAARAAPSSEAWVAAQAQLSALDSARAPTAAALSALDSRFVDMAAGVASNTAVGGLAETEAARAEVEGLYNRQIERLQTLRTRLAQP